MLRRNYGVAEDPVKRARDEACRIYLAPEILCAVNPSPTGPADVFSYAVILVEIATRIDPYSVCAVMCMYMHTCVIVYVYAYVYVHIYVIVYLYMCIYDYMCVIVCVCVCVCVCNCVHT